MGEDATSPERAQDEADSGEVPPGAAGPPPATYARVRELYVRFLGLVFVVAFLSLEVQLDGLLGAGGILPVADLVPRVVEILGGRDWSRFPSLFLWGTSDALLHGACWAGVGAGLLALLGILPGPALLVAWALYLSFVHAGQVFLSFQWDTLLLEAGLLGAAMAPWGMVPRPGSWPDPGPGAAWLGRLLLAKLMFQSGVVKLTSQDPLWRRLTALGVHYETQPLPTPLGWWAHQLPAWVQQASCAAMFVVELVFPALVFLGRRPRQVAAAGFLGLMLLIALTGNYTFFNALTALLALWCLDDDALAWAVRPGPRDHQDHRLRRGLSVGLAAGYGLVCALQVHGLFVREGTLADLRNALLRPVRPLLSCNSYGLFARMTRARPEIVVEASMDGETWEPYVFRYKPGPPGRRPPWVAPHQPRLDWQMWFAALGTWRQNQWFMLFLQRLAERSPAVLGLLESEPFPGTKPRYLRARVFRYRFTSGGEAWWTRELAGEYCPPLEQRDPGLRSGH